MVFPSRFTDEKTEGRLAIGRVYARARSGTLSSLLMLPLVLPLLPVLEGQKDGPPEIREQRRAEQAGEIVSARFASVNFKPRSMKP